MDRVGLRDERGSFLIETIVAAVLVAVIAIAMLSAFDGANRASGRTKIRAIAGSLAQSDQERMRSMPVSMLSGLAAGQSQDKFVDGVKYKVDSRAEWLADDTASTSCTANGNAGDYMEITSSVSSPSQPGLKPVVVKSLVTPAPGTLGVNQGSLAVTVVDRRGVGVPDLTVSLNGPISASDVTDKNGCAFFGYEPVGNYTAETARAGWVDVMGRPKASKPVSIASQQVSTMQLQYDAAGSAAVTFKTNATDYPSSPRAGVTGTARGIRLSHSQMEPPYVRDGAAPLGSSRWGNAGDQTAIVADSVFPLGDMTVTPQQVSPYRVYAGTCDANDPNNQSPAQTSDTVQIEPGKQTPATVFLPALNIRTAASAKRIKITAKSAGCSGVWTFTNADLNAAGNLTFPGLPYGTYLVCVDDNNGAATKNRSITVNNFSRAGTSPVDLTTLSASGAC